jgi:DNA adenine methylase
MPMSSEASRLCQPLAKPVLKWAGGKSQLIAELNARAPEKYNKYIEPFFGSGALFFNLLPEKAVISDSNPELVNLYQCLAKDPYKIISFLKTFKNDSIFFYELRAKDAKRLNPYFAAARTIYLNKTCFNGLYRVNKKGQFNVPFGKHRNPKICDEDGIIAASIALQGVKIIKGDYKTVLRNEAEPGDYIFLDPPYLPISKYSDFKRYTKEQFYDEDHQELAEEIMRLHNLGCYVLLTNSNHPLVHELYKDFKIEILKTKRFINSNGAKRTGEDVIVTIPPKPKSPVKKLAAFLPSQIERYPSTRWMGSKSKLLPYIHEILQKFEFDTAMDLFSGSGIVGYLFKSLGKTVISNDYMALSATYAKAMIENNSVTLDIEKAKKLLEISPGVRFNKFVQETFENLYFTNQENNLIDILRHNIHQLSNTFEKAIAMSALLRTCTKKRPRGIFTYIGTRYDDGRKDLKLSFEEHFINSVIEINGAVFSNGKKNISRCGDAMTIKSKADLIYIDPPYFSPLSDNEYVRRYHFVEGLAVDWKGVEIQWHTKTKKFKNYPTPFSSQKGAYDAFDKLFKKFKDSILLISYSSNSLPSIDDMTNLLSKYKSTVEVKKINYKYSFGTQKEENPGNDVQEYIFIGF